MDQHTPGRSGAVWALVITSVAGFMAALDNLVVTTALPSIRESLGGELAELEWTVNAYTLTFAVLLMLGAALGDRFGRRRLLPRRAHRLHRRLGRGRPLARDQRTDRLPGRSGRGRGDHDAADAHALTAAVPAARRGAALGIFSAVTGLAVASGPLIGGSLTEYLSWQWIFWLNVPIGLALLPLARLRLTESYAPDSRLDIPGTLLVSAGLFGIVYGLVNANSDGWTSPTVLTALFAGAALIGWFIHHGFHAKNPMLPMRLFRNRAFFGINMASLLMFLGMFGSIFLLSQYFQGVLDYSPTEAGLRMLPWTGMPMLVAPIAGTLSDRFGGRPVVVAGLALQALGLAFFAMVIGPDASYAAQLPGLIVGGVGMALYFAPAASLVMSSVRPAEQGIASGANNALREVGGALGVAILATVFSSQGGYGSAQSFTDGTVPAVWIGAGAVALAALVALLIPGRRKASAPDAPEPEAAGERVPVAA